MARSNARLEVSGAGKTEDGLVQYNEEVNRLEDDLRELYETIRVNVDEEEQWKVFDFVEDFFMEELEIGDYINDINSYHLHMFDKHDVTTKKLDVIVEKAGKVDANYAAQIEGYCSLLGEYGKKFETVCAMLALDLIGVKVFRYSDETAEAVASGEKLLKESGTIYESFADMMSPEDAKRYLDFLENGSREGLTGAELAGVEKTDALLVSRKVGYDDVWDLRNVGDLLETSYGKSTLNSLKNTENFTDSAIEHIFEGQVNARGKAVGYHYKGIEGTSGNVIPETESSTNNFGIYKAKVEVNGIPKTANGGFSSFYPKSMSPQEVIGSINEAYRNRVYIRGNTYSGLTSSGMEIEMFLDKNGKIISAYPVY